MAEITYLTVAESFRARLENLPDGQKKPWMLTKMMNDGYSRYAEALDCVDIKIFKQIIREIFKGWIKKKIFSYFKKPKQAPFIKQPARFIPKEGDGRMFIEHQIELFGLNPDSY
ncbi:MAG TPA: hypothetical protein VL576_02585 [Candidatus Paceibacterota bacterium]|jgi:hypothetical protein|nr:hypothetical protein [Candidatus Paceibacterota bacterium]